MLPWPEKQCHPIPLSKAWVLPVHQGPSVCFAQKTAGGRGGPGHPPAVVPGEVSGEGPCPRGRHQGGRMVGWWWERWFFCTWGSFGKVRRDAGRMEIQGP